MFGFYNVNYQISVIVIFHTKIQVSKFSKKIYNKTGEPVKPLVRPETKPVWNYRSAKANLILVPIFPVPNCELVVNRNQPRLVQCEKLSPSKVLEITC